MTTRVLVVEDDDLIAPALIRTLEREGYDVQHVENGAAALEHVTTVPTDLVLLDLGLPDISGLDVCRQMRGAGFEGGVLIVTARDGELDRVVGLDVGADDYLPKPFSLAELHARMRAILRRGWARPHSAGERAFPTVPDGSGSPSIVGQAIAGNSSLVVDPRTRRVTISGMELPLTAKEFDVLALLYVAGGAVVTRERLMDEVWDENWFGSTKTLDATVGRLRQKLEQGGSPVRVGTVRGVGFRLEDDHSPS